MDIIYQQGKASAADVREAMPDPPSYSAIRALLKILETKGHLRHVKDGARYIYLPTQPRLSAARSAVKQILQTFFGGSVERAVATMISVSEAELSDDELARLAALIDQTKKGERA